MVDLLATPDVADDVVFLGLSLRRDDAPDRLADHLLGGEAEQPLRPRVPRGDDAVQRLADDGVVARLDDRREALGLKMQDLGARGGHAPHDSSRYAAELRTAAARA